MTAKHTPGPWRRENGELVGSNGALVRVAGTGIGLAMRDTPEALANGRLFLAGPDMLAELHDIVPALADARDRMVKAGDYAAAIALEIRRVHAKRAIAKATGDEA
jgi:hypothetical protein